jgi:NAD(P)H-hydrate epimerase
VDLVHFCSPAIENNDLVRSKLKSKFWDGIVVDWEFVETYIAEDDAIVIGPGLPREEGLVGAELPTGDITNSLLKRYPDKKWVVDGGALQEVDPRLLNQNCIVTPHLGELKRLVDKTEDQFLMSNFETLNTSQLANELILRRAEYLQKLSKKLNGATILSKAVVDMVCNQNECWPISGGNEGLTKGGSGDILAGLTGALYCTNEAWISAASASFALKTAADELYQTVGPYYNSSELVKQIPKTFWQLLRR